MRNAAARRALVGEVVGEVGETHGIGFVDKVNRTTALHDVITVLRAHKRVLCKCSFISLARSYFMRTLQEHSYVLTGLKGARLHDTNLVTRQVEHVHVDEVIEAERLYETNVVVGQG